ncbi:S-ribosylhomocysteine lyase, partial [Campylobacter coli]|nr:S-ribosylhomocysteine lyase [Campylobacter coli]
MKKKIKNENSPDADYIFMYIAIKLGWIGNDIDYKNNDLDIKTI